MKSLLAIILLAAACQAAPVTLAWDGVTGAESYELRYVRVETDGTKTAGKAKATTTQVAADLLPGVYQFEVVAMAGTLVSAPSERITYTVPLDPPKRLRITTYSSPDMSRGNKRVEMVAYQSIEGASRFWFSEIETVSPEP